MSESKSTLWMKPSRPAGRLFFCNFLGNGRIMPTFKTSSQQHTQPQGETAVSPAARYAQQAAQPHSTVTPGSKQKNLFAAFFFKYLSNRKATRFENLISNLQRSKNATLISKKEETYERN
jgi:hypothetical protein